jgi:hypothetical protein
MNVKIQSTVKKPGRFPDPAFVSNVSDIVISFELLDEYSIISFCSARIVKKSKEF